MLREKIKKVNIIKEKKFSKPIKVLWFSNDPQITTGYAKVTREILLRLSKDPRFDVAVLAEGYSGQPKNFFGLQVFGVRLDSVRNDIQKHLGKLKPDILIALEDTFTLANFDFHKLNLGKTKLMLYVPMDGNWIPSTGQYPLRIADKLIAMSSFSKQVLKKEGYKSNIILHGVDLSMFKPISKDRQNELKRKFEIDPNKYVFFNFGRNSMRKFNHRLVSIMARVLTEIPDSIFVLNVLQYDAKDLNLTDYIHRHIKKEFGKDIVKRILFNEKLSVNKIFHVPDIEVAEMMQMSDMIVSASTGEGSGLIMPESMACMKPIVHTDYTTPVEWLIEEKEGIGERGVIIPCKDQVVSSYNVEHGHVDEDKFVKGILDYYKNKKLQEQHTKNGRLFVERYANWDYLVEQWKQNILEVA